MAKIKIAMCQIFALDSDRSGNFLRVENAVRQAAKAGASLACFPETAILGWINPDAHKRAYPVPGKDTERLAALARKYNTHICIGLAEKDGDRLFNSAVLIDNKGELLLKHRKMNILNELMTPPYTPGQNVGVAQTELGQIGLLICADTFDGDVLGKMAALKPDIVLVPYGWAADEDKWPEHGKSLANVVKNTTVNIGTAVVGTDLVGEITNGP